MALALLGHTVPLGKFQVVDLAMDFWNVCPVNVCFREVSRISRQADLIWFSLMASRRLHWSLCHSCFLSGLLLFLKGWEVVSSLSVSHVAHSGHLVIEPLLTVFPNKL